MLTAHQLSKSYGIQTVLHDVTFSVNPGDRVGLVGPNGCGKSTLLAILAGVVRADGGHVDIPRDLRLGYLSQGFEPDPDLTLPELLGRAAGDRRKLEAELAELGVALARQPEDAELQSSYEAALDGLNQLNVDRLRGVQQALGLDGIDPAQPVGTLSGGQQTRVALALMLLGDPDLLLLDEPTNHLDIAMLEWLEGWLADFPGGVLIASHDRTFLDRTVDRVLDLDPETHTVRQYDGNYTTYVAQVLGERDKHWAAWRAQEAEVRRVKQDIARTKEQALWVERTTTSREPSVRRYAKKVAKKAKSREKKLDRFLDSDERVGKPKAGWQMSVEFGDVRVGRDVLTLDGLTVGFPGRTPLLRGLDLALGSGERVALTGPNGCGKTTLLRTIAGELPPADGRFRLGSSVRLGYLAQDQQILDPAKSALEAIQAVAPQGETEVRTFLHFFLFGGDDPLRPASELSFGERARLALAVLVAQGSNFLLLDEPINHLDVPSRERFEAALTQFGGTVLAVVHDRYFIERFATVLWTVEADGIRRDVGTGEAFA